MRTENEMSLLEWQKIMKDGLFLNIERLTIAGGEPFLHPQLIELTKIFLDSMPKLQSLTLITNGFLTDLIVSQTEKLIQLTRKRQINFSISVSLDGIGKLHDELRGTRGAFKKTKSTILALKSLKEKYHFWLGVAGLVCHNNLKKISLVKDWCYKESIPFNYQLVGFHETYVQNINEKNKLDFTRKERGFLLKLLKRLGQGHSFKELESYYWQDMHRLYKNGSSRSTPCPFLLDAFAVDSLGDVYYCLSERKIGNCRKGGEISEIYYKQSNLAFRRQLSKTACLKCNSACFIRSGIKKDFKKYFWFYLAGRIFSEQ